MRRFLYVVILSLLLLGLGCGTRTIAPSAGSGQAPAEPGSAPTASTQKPGPNIYPLTIKDDLGREITFSGPPQRIVSLSPGHTEIFFAMDANDKVVGTDDFSDYPAEAASRPKVGYSKIDLEKLVGLEPDLVIAVTRQKAAVPEMERLGLRVLFLSESENLKGLLEKIRLLGKVIGRPEEGEKVAGDMEMRIEAITAKLKGVPQGPKIFYEISPQLHTTSPNTFIGDVLILLKTVNIAQDVKEPFPRLSQEKIIAEDPQVIILGDADAGESPEVVKARPGWGKISAVASGRIILVPNRDIIHRPGPRVVEGLEMLAKALYPELFR